MELCLLAFFIVLAVGAALGWTADSRDFADWRATDQGLRRSPRDG